DRVDEHRPRRRDAVVALAQLFRDEVEIEPVARVQPLEAGEDRGLRGGIDRGRLVAADPLADDRLPLVPARHPVEHSLHVLDRVAAKREPGVTGTVPFSPGKEPAELAPERPHGTRGWKRRPETSFG